jgi:16S rRNA (uracil1498-N3)-methyltransferase
MRIMTDHKLPRLYVPQALRAREKISLDSTQTHYLLHVLRRKAGDQLRLFQDASGEFIGTIEAISKKGCVVLLEKQTRAPADTMSITLCFAPIKRQRLELLLEKATELGVTHLQPVKTQHSMDIGNTERLQAIVTEAAEQCERLTVPQICPLKDLKTLIGQWNSTTPLYWCLERAGAPLLQTLDAAKPISLLTGPEGGFSQEEMAWLHTKDFVKAVSLGPTVLRAETAAIVALGCTQAYLSQHERRVS